MAGTWISECFPQFEAQLQQLVQQHRDLKDEPLHLALAYAPMRDQQDIFLFEVVSNVAAMVVNPDRELFETVFASTPGFAMNSNQRLHLLLTSPEEFRVAMEENWPSAQEILAAVRADDFQVLCTDEIGKKVLDEIRQSIRQLELVRG